ncbi:MerR family transcriptional regulator [Mariniflexile gromovii]|uniref:MerR family transcriptional regulator n=1 Tax=Mariniflexile gromovii TaxID=362523 RepID=A0ABS4BW14_9FLAO|nr:MerR family transcriptional regulator [Mariniflexile gromovii]MBP0904255.1 MerR family transcriptional regulator [Mariniflexile gromovii]
MKKYSVKDLSKLAGVSVRTLHHYDDIGLLKPAIRTEAKYRLYGENELLKLQQILFYKELEFTLQEIIDILEDPDFDLIQALKNHKRALKTKQQQISLMLNTIEKTMSNLKNKTMITDNELYEGFSKEERDEIRNEAIEKYGNNTIKTSEKYLKKLSKEQLEQLKKEQQDIFKNLFRMSSNSPKNEEVQLEIARHYSNIRKFWGTDGVSDAQKKEYRGLGKLYAEDPRFTLVDGKPQPEFAKFLYDAMRFFANSQLD